VGSVVLRFEVDRHGKISNVRMLQNTSDSSFAMICEKALLDTKLPTPGKGVFDRETGSRFEMTQKFSIYDF
jgi:hypothetical protein